MMQAVVDTYIVYRCRLYGGQDNARSSDYGDHTHRRSDCWLAMLATEWTGSLTGEGRVRGRVYRRRIDAWTLRDSL